jgi:hypothetical protein
MAAVNVTGKYAESVGLQYVQWWLVTDTHWHKICDGC